MGEKEDPSPLFITSWASSRILTASVIHIIDCEEATIICRESHRTTRWIRDAVRIRQEAQDVMNRDEGVFLLSHVYDEFCSPLLTL